MTNHVSALFEVEKTPHVIKLQVNRTTTTLVRSGDKENPYWVGVPADSKGNACRFALRIRATGEIQGSAAIRFITAGGWAPGAKWPPRGDIINAQSEFTRKFIHAAIKAEGVAITAGVAEYLSQEAGLPVEKGEVSVRDDELFSLLAKKGYLLRLARDHGLRFVVDVVGHMESYVSKAYATCVEGEWDNESDEVADTSNLRSSHIRMMRIEGLKFQKVRRRRSAR